MNLERLFNDLAKNISNKVLNRKEERSIKINLNDIGSGDIIKIIVKRLVKDGNYNKAENIIFEELKKSYSEEICEVALDFYNQLLEKTDKELTEGNFSREEIYQGLEDIKNMF